MRYTWDISVSVRDLVHSNWEWSLLDKLLYSLPCQKKLHSILSSRLNCQFEWSRSLTEIEISQVSKSHLFLWICHRSYFKNCITKILMNLYLSNYSFVSIIIRYWSFAALYSEHKWWTPGIMQYSHHGCSDHIQTTGETHRHIQVSDRSRTADDSRSWQHQGERFTGNVLK